MKALRLIHVARFTFCVLLMLQCGFLTAYPVKYQGDLRLIPIFLLYAPSVVYWIYCLRTQVRLLTMFYTWCLYVVIALVPIIIIIFAFGGEHLETKKPLTPNTLKVMLCFTPILFLLLVNTASDLNAEDYRQLASKLSVQITIDLFDAVALDAGHCTRRK